MITNLDFSENLKMLRKKSNLTQSDIADFLQISRQSVSKWEMGISLPSLIFLEPLSEILNCSIEELLCINNS